MVSFELLAVISLIVLAFGDLLVGVANDAVNFLNSAIGSKVSSRKIILIVASIGVIIGATFSDGIIEVARKGVFDPSFFSLNEAIIVFTAVALADLLLLDLYSTFGLPTSTTVSIVFELLGASVVFAFWKMGSVDSAFSVVNGDSVTKIIIGILMSIAVAFVVGLIGQFVSRLIFTFDYKKRFLKYGFLWSGVALTSLIFFILIKGGNHATFMMPGIKEWISLNTDWILLGSFIVFSILSFILIRLKVNMLKLIVLAGTGSLAMAFAGNDLANFIGVSVAGTHAFLGADLSEALPTPTWVLLLAGLVMTFALFTSKKSRTVTSTEVNLASHENQVMNHWKSNIFADKMVKIGLFLYGSFLSIVPSRLQTWFGRRWNHIDNNEEKSAFDFIRASVNLMISATIISYATYKKLPLLKRPQFFHLAA